MTRFSLTTIIIATLCACTLAQSNPEGTTGECEKSIKVVTQGDLDAIKGCKSFRGAITVDSTGITNLNLEGVEQLTGDLLMMNNFNLLSFSAPHLKSVNGQVKIENHTHLNKLDLPQLTQVRDLNLSVLPALENIDFPAGLSQISSLVIKDTRAPNVRGFRPSTIESFSLSSNNYMTSFDFSSVKESTRDIVILGNNPSFTFEAPNLVSLRMANFFNLGGIDMPALVDVRSDISFHENDFTSLHLDAVETVGGTMTIANNNRLTETSFKGLQRIIGALAVGNNTQLTTIDGFPKLAEIHGVVDLAGSFDEYKLPSLQDVRGGMRLQTTSSKFGCSESEKKLKGDNVVKGNTWSCSASMQETDMLPTVGQTPSSSPKSGNSNGSGGSTGNTKNAPSDANLSSIGSSNSAQGSWLALTVGLVYAFWS
ncbi:hypothetical protein BDB01DRAFT_736596 [Pilobolus umbonatus]|nr:hypothetical protein BDB01DRAFT_736596 [Pilobolus umbonatus]